MKNLFVSVSLCLSSSLMWGQQIDTLRVSDIGINPDTYESCTAKLQEAFRICREKKIKVLQFDEGRYDIWTEGAIHRDIFISNTSSEEECPSKDKTLGILIEDQQGLTIDGQGATLMFHGLQTMISIIHSTGITLKNLHIDCERPGGSEVTYQKVDGEGTIVRFHPDSKYAINKEGHLDLIGEGWRTIFAHCIEFNPKNDHFTYSDGWDKLSKSKAHEVEPGVVRFDTPADFKPEVGNTLTIRDRIRSQVGILNLESSQVTYQNVFVHYMHGLGIVSQFCTDVTMDHVECAPREGSGRVLASSADFMHFSGCRGKVRVTSCRFSGAHDDPINVHGTNLRAISAEGEKSLRLRFMHHQTYGMQAYWPGDTVAFIHSTTLQRYSKAVVTDVKRISDREVLLSIDRALPKDIVWDSDAVENYTWTPEVEISCCHFTHTNTRGTLLTTPRKVQVLNNTYYKTGMSAILIAADARDWYESGPVCDVLIQNNRFIDCTYNGGHGNAVISLEPSNTVVDKKLPVHRNIRILDNYFETWGNPVLYAKSTQGLIFQGNTIKGTKSEESFRLEGCTKTSIQK